ncbi:hypothetical protein K469DRAFT_332566 [Zopfia rhizophila CBS 207.26]|uniref:C2H2-type domain-containing protein n=1 Tax=Zopfia rhizophila CBS 207.26 TaxID=1314779 RepID=A0A6A6DG09_9PEZI|nr:hypothetical protein K469DRAFT_332566 [Zopfia rhizophila CBS 207.26]
MEDSQMETRGQKRAREEPADDVSTLTDLDSRDFDDVTLARDDPYHLIGIPQPKRRRPREDTELWSYALEEPPEGQPARGNSNQELFYCKRCRKGCSSASAFRSHLKSKHGVIANPAVKTRVEQKANWLAAGFKLQQQRAENSSVSQKAKILRDSVNQADWLNVLVLMIVNHNLPLSITEWPEFHLLMKISNYTLVERGGPMRNSRSSVRRLIGKTYEVSKEAIKQKLAKSLSKIHLTTDIWLSPNNSHYQAITAHFVDKLGRVQKATLALREHKRGYGAEEQAEIIQRVLKEFDISKEKIGYLTGTSFFSY